MVNDLLHHLASINDHPQRCTGANAATQHLNHTFTSSPESDNSSQCVSPTTLPTPASKLEVPMLILPACTVPGSGSTTSSSTSSLTSSADSDSDSESLASKALTRSDCQLEPKLLITYNETTLRCLNSRPQIQTLNSLLLSLPNDPESDNDHSQSDYRDQEESPTSCTALQCIVQGREVPVDTGRVTNDTESQDHVRSHQQCSGSQQSPALVKKWGFINVVALRKAPDKKVRWRPNKSLNIKTLPLGTIS